MDFKSSPLGLLYARLENHYQGDRPANKNLDDCELRANSKKDGDLRVKTGYPSGWSSKARKAHQTNAVVILGKKFSESMDRLLSERKNLQFQEAAAIRNAGVKDWNDYSGPKGCVTLGDVRELHARVVRVFNENLPKTPAKNTSTTLVIVQPSSILPASGSPTSPSAIASASSSSALSSSGAAQSRHWTVVSPASSAGASAASASLGQSPGLHSAEALVALKAQYPFGKFLSAHGENDAASPANKQSAFHAKLDTLVKIAERHLPRLVKSQAKEGGFKTLSSAATAMKVNPGMHPAAALYLQLHGPAAGTIYQAYSQEVDAHVSKLTQMSPSEMAEMRKQAGKPE